MTSDDFFILKRPNAIKIVNRELSSDWSRVYSKQERYIDKLVLHVIDDSEACDIALAQDRDKDYDILPGAGYYELPAMIESFVLKSMDNTKTPHVNIIVHYYKDIEEKKEEISVIDYNELIGDNNA